jgi:hypothetical protein
MTVSTYRESLFMKNAVELNFILFRAIPGIGFFPLKVVGKWRWADRGASNIGALYMFYSVRGVLPYPGRDTGLTSQYAVRVRTNFSWS